MVKSIPAQLSMWHLMTSEASPSVTSSPGSADGDTPCVLPDGQTTGQSGQGAAPASRFRSQAKALVLTIHGTSGPTSTASSSPADPLSSWESKLRGRLGTDGSMEFALIWKELATPAGRSIFRLSRSTPRTFASDSTGSQWTWPTPDTCAGGTGPSQANRNSPRLQDLVPLLSPWSTPQARDWKDTGSLDVLKKVASGKRTSSSVARDVALSTWPTPTKADGDGGHGMGTASVTGKRENGSKITVSLPGVVKIVSTWRTPATTEPGVRLERLETADGQPWTPGQRAYDKQTGRVAQVGLTHEVLATWPTPTSVNRVRDEETLAKCAAFRLRNANQKTVPLYLGEVVANTVHSGQTPSGSPDQTAKPGALNPAFPCWLMGYPTEWDACAPTVMPSSRRSRQK